MGEMAGLKVINNTLIFLEKYYVNIYETLISKVVYFSSKNQILGKISMQLIDLKNNLKAQPLEAQEPGSLWRSK